MDDWADITASMVSFEADFKHEKDSRRVLLDDDLDGGHGPQAIADAPQPVVEDPSPKEVRSRACTFFKVLEHIMS